MFIDASALTTLLTDEEEARELLARLQQTGTRLTSPLAVWEAAVAVARVLDLSVSAAAEAIAAAGEFFDPDAQHDDEPAAEDEQNAEEK